MPWPLGLTLLFTLPLIPSLTEGALEDLQGLANHSAAGCRQAGEHKQLAQAAEVFVNSHAVRGVCTCLQVCAVQCLGPCCAAVPCCTGRD